MTGFIGFETAVSRLMNKIGKEFGVEPEKTKNAAQALIEDVILGCQELGIPSEPEVDRMVDGYDNPVYVRFVRNGERYVILEGIFSSNEEAETDDVDTDRVYHVVRDQNSSVTVYIMEDMNPGKESDEFPWISRRISSRSDLDMGISDNGDYKLYPAIIKGVRLVPSIRQINGMEPIDPRFLIREI